MHARYRRAVRALAITLLLPTALIAQSNLTDPDYLALGRKYYDWFVAAQADSILAHMSQGTREDAGGLEGITQAAGEFASRAGAELNLIEEKMTRRRGQPQYWRESEYSAFAAEPLVLRWVLDEQGQITGIGMGPKSGTPAPD